jgi:mRNA interferase YafQ
MRKLIPTPKFHRALRKFTKRNATLRANIQETLELMEADVFAASLETHKLSGNLDGIMACSCGYDCRVLFLIEQEPETGINAIVLLDVGSHDSVY